MVRREIGLKKVRQVISSMVDIKMHTDNSKGEASSQWKPLVSLAPKPGESPLMLSHAEDNLRTCGIGAAVLRQKLPCQRLQCSGVFSQSFARCRGPQDKQ